MKKKTIARCDYKDCPNTKTVLAYRINGKLVVICYFHKQLYGIKTSIY